MSLVLAVSLPDCLVIAARAVGDSSGWALTEWEDQLRLQAQTRGDPTTTYYRPYAAAIAYLMRPSLQAKTEGAISETYTDLQKTVRYLEGLESEWAAEFPPISAESPDLSLKLEYQPWG